MLFAFFKNKAYFTIFSLIFSLHSSLKAHLPKLTKDFVKQKTTGSAYAGIWNNKQNTGRTKQVKQHLWRREVEVDVSVQDTAPGARGKRKCCQRVAVWERVGIDQMKRGWWTQMGNIETEASRWERSWTRQGVLDGVKMMGRWIQTRLWDRGWQVIDGTRWRQDDG